MKITDIQPMHVSGDGGKWSFVKVQTDEGLVGWGEGTLEWREQAWEGAVRDLSGHLIGEDPRPVENHCRRLYRDGYWQNDTTLQTALSAIEMALWDILGKSLDRPVYELLGGPLRDRVRAYANGWSGGARTPEELGHRAVEAVRRGYTALKWDPFGRTDLAITRDSLERAVESVGRVREAVGPLVDLLIEGHGRLNLPSAIQVAQRIEQYNVTFFEEPLPSENIDAMAELQRSTRTIIATGERLCTPYQFRELLERRAARIIQPDITHAGGISGLRRIAALAESWYVPVAPHSPNGPIVLAATLQFAACTHNFLILEFAYPGSPLRDEVSTQPLVVEDGHVLIPSGPGLGIDLVDEALARHPWSPRSAGLWGR